MTVQLTFFLCGALSRVLDEKGAHNHRAEPNDFIDQQNFSSIRDTCIHLLQNCLEKRDLEAGKMAHIFVVANGVEFIPLLGSLLVRMFAACTRISEARQAFMKSLVPNAFSWSALISVHVKLGENEQALKLYQEMRCTPVKMDGYVLVAVLKACSNLEDGEEIHSHAIAMGLESDVFVGSTLIDIYLKCGGISDSCMVFERMPMRNIVTWSALIKGLTHHDYNWEALQVFQQMQQVGVDPDPVSFISILKACASVIASNHTYDVHAHIIGMGFEFDPAICNGLVDFYVRCADIEAACIMFKRLPTQDVVACSILIAGFTQHNHGQKAIEMFEQMQKNGLELDIIIFLGMLKACSHMEALEYGRILHSCLIGRGYESEVTIGSTLIDMYAKCGSLLDAQVVFYKLPEQNIVTWNAFIMGFSHHECDEDVFRLFDLLQQEGMTPDWVTFAAVLKACAATVSLKQGQQIHHYILQAGFESDKLIGNTLVDMYAKCGSLADAHAVFDRLPVRDVVTWSALIGGFTQFECADEAFELFDQMQRDGTDPDPVAFACILKACSDPDDLHQGRKIHSQAVYGGWEGDGYLGSTLIDMYATCGSLEDACVTFEKLQNRTVVAWNALIMGHITNDLEQEALKTFERMQDFLEPNMVTFVCALKACSNTVAFNQGRQIHGHIVGNGCETDVIIASTLINMYAKCGDLEAAGVLFERLCNRNIVTWSALMAGHAQHNNYSMALQCFEGMQQAGFKPDDVAFLCLLSACSRVGLSKKGCSHFKSMRDDHGITPKLEHYNTMLDIFGYHGDLGEAEDLLETIPCRANVVGWTSLLSCCRRDARVDVAKRIFDYLALMDGGNAAGYVLMSSIYCQAGMLDDAKTVEELRKHVNGWKKPAKAYIEVNNKVHDFIVGDKIHPKCDEIYAKMQALSNRLKVGGYQPNFFWEFKSSESRELALCGQMEKLAVAFGLTNSTQGT